MIFFFSQEQLEDTEECRSPTKEGRVIFYDVGDENGEVDDAKKGAFFTFKGSCVDDLKEKLKEETGLDDILVCCRNPLTAKLYPLRLQLPPNNTDMHVVVVPSSFIGKLFLFYTFFLCYYLHVQQSSSLTHWGCDSHILNMIFSYLTIYIGS